MISSATRSGSSNATGPPPLRVIRTPFVDAESRHALGVLPSPLRGGVGGGGPSANHRTTPTPAQRSQACAGCASLPACADPPHKGEGKDRVRRSRWVHFTRKPSKRAGPPAFERCQLHGLWVELELSGFDLRQVEHLVDEAKKVSTSTVRALQLPTEGGGRYAAAQIY